MPLVPKVTSDVSDPDMDVGAPRSDDMDVVSTRQKRAGGSPRGAFALQRPPGNEYRQEVQI